jgi:AcrR family transcriptional regulator
MSNREEAKHKRRRQIVRAARALMQQTGDTGFSMRALAEQAGVSIATPYNLFGSKQTIMFAVLDADLESYQKRLAKVRVDELDVFFKAVSLATSLYSTEPAFYRAVLLAVYNDGGREFRSMFGGPRHAMWKGFVQDAIDSGDLSDDVEPDAFAINLGRTFFSAILEWANGQLTLPELDAWAQYGFALSLSAMATPKSAERLHEKAVAQQKRLVKLWKRAASGGRQTRNGQARSNNGTAVAH